MLAGGQPARQLNAQQPAIFGTADYWRRLTHLLAWRLFAHQSIDAYLPLRSLHGQPSCAGVTNGCHGVTDIIEHTEMLAFFYIPDANSWAMQRTFDCAVGLPARERAGIFRCQVNKGQRIILYGTSF